MTARAIESAGGTFAATSAREAFGLVAAAVPDYASLTYGAVGATGRVLGTIPQSAPAGAEAR